MLFFVCKRVRMTEKCGNFEAEKTFTIEKLESPHAFVKNYFLIFNFFFLFSSIFHRIREVADKLNKYGSHTFPALNQIKVQVKQVVVGPSHLGILLEDGRALRVAYSVITERLDLSKPEKTK